MTSEDNKNEHDKRKDATPRSTSYLKSNSQSVEDYESIASSYNCRNSFPNDPEFERIVAEAMQSIEAGNLPKLSPKGTSGCYFVSDREKVFII